MKRSRLCQVVLAATGMLTASIGATTAGAAPSDVAAPPTFQEYESSTFRDVQGQYVVNGDETISTRKALRAYYDRMTGKQKKGDSQSLVVNTVGGADDTWSQGAVGSLTYCVSTAFGSQQSAVINAMNGGAALWENASSAIDFVYVSSANSNCRTSNSSVVFSVEPTSTTEYIARAFFPSSPDSQRNILVNATSLQSSGSWTPANILGHELGHTLGFRHEHTRPESGTCFEDNSWRPLTPYDSVSIMHYPQCNGGSSNLTFSSNDGQGVRALYGS